MEVKAYLRNLRIAPRKVRLVLGLICGLAVNDALAQLKFMRKQAALPVAKLIRSAMANAEHNFKLDPDALYIKKLVVDGGPVLDRWRARAFGRAAPIRKRMSHVTLVLEIKDQRPKTRDVGSVRSKPIGEKVEKKVVEKTAKAAKKPARKAAKKAVKE